MTKVLEGNNHGTCWLSSVLENRMGVDPGFWVALHN